ncbi:MAG: 2-hydroxyacyl-CoA dehydratase [Clostridia bacterium]|nr:2-hydroxyacyl-CoA dehydratase [Clostridia bacterium]
MVRQQLADLYKEAEAAKARGEKIGWSASIFPQEICETLGITVVFPENHSAGVAARHQAEPYLNRAEGEQEYNNDLCSYAKINLAYIETRDLPEHNMPMPDFLLCANNICNQVTKWYENIGDKYGVPVYMLDMVYNHQPFVTPTRMKYIRAQMDDIIASLEELTGKKFDQDRFREVMEISSENKDLWMKANELLSNTPAPLNGFELFNYMSAMVCCRGKRSTTEIMKQLISEIEEHIKNGTSTYPVEEKYRIFWEGIACWPHVSHNLKVMKRLGMNIVATAYVRSWALDYIPGDLDSLARAYSFTSSNNVPIETLVERRSRDLIKFKCDGMVYHLNRSCKVMDMQQAELQRRVTEKTGVPYVSFDGDQSDFRNYSEAQFETRMEAFTEVMDQFKAMKNEK